MKTLKSRVTVLTIICLTFLTLGFLSFFGAFNSAEATYDQSITLESGGYIDVVDSLKFVTNTTLTNEQLDLLNNGKYVSYGQTTHSYSYYLFVIRTTDEIGLSSFRNSSFNRHFTTDSDDNLNSVILNLSEFFTDFSYKKYETSRRNLIQTAWTVDSSHLDCSYLSFLIEKDLVYFSSPSGYSYKDYYFNISTTSNTLSEDSRPFIYTYLNNYEVDLSDNVNLNEYVSHSIKYQQILGIYSESDAVISYSYIRMKNDSFWDYEVVSSSFQIPSTYYLNEKLVYQYLYNLLEISDVTGFNANYQYHYRRYNEESQEFEYLLEERTIRQADSLSYDYNISNHTGEITVNYAPYKYKDFFVKIENNDPEDHLSFNLYTIDAKTVGDNTVLTFSFQTLEEQLYNAGRWLAGRYVEEENEYTGAIDTVFVPGLNKDDFSVDGIFNNVNVTIGDREIVVTFPMDKEEQLFGIGIVGVARIVPDVEMNIYCEYIELNENLDPTTRRTPIEKMMYSDIVRFSDTNFYLKYEESIMEGISPAVLGGKEFYKFKGVSKVYSNDGKTCTIKVLYDFNSLLRIENDQNDLFEYVELDFNTLHFKANQFNFNVPTGWRIKGIKALSSYITVNFNEKNPGESDIIINRDTNENQIFTIRAELTDKWILQVNYFTRYKQSPFAEKTTFNGEIKVSDYNNIYNLTRDDLVDIMDDSLDLLGISHVESISIKFNGIDTYIIDTTYSVASLKKTNYDGSFDEVKVPLMAYSDWTDMFGKDWTILMLNGVENKYFQYSDDVKLEDLYGFFSVAVFKERVSDLNYYFQDYVGKGCKTCFTSKEVVGSDIYKFFSNMGVLGFGGMWTCEIFNQDNAMYYSYFFYIDGTSDLPYMALNGADDYDDNQSAISNRIEDFGDGIRNFFTGGSVLSKVVIGIIIAVAVLVLLGLFIPIVKWVIRKIKG